MDKRILFTIPVNKDLIAILNEFDKPLNVNIKNNSYFLLT